MLMLHSLQLIMLIMAALLLRRRRAIIFIVIFSIVCYFLTFDRGVPLWVNYGQEHYALQEKLDDLGGVNAIISQIKARLAKNPNDATGWRILGKLYHSQQNEPAAQEAFAKADSTPSP
jgi:cytochrome c-type biogenesis protein CcmH/NrfG